MTDTDSDSLPAGVKLIDWDDMPTRRRMIFDSIKDSFTKQFPVSYGGMRLNIDNIHYDDPKDFNLTAQKKALLDNRFLHWKLKGTARLADEATGQVIEERPMTLMKVPYLTERGTFVHNGSEYVTMSMARLLPGVYTRRKATGELESHFNAKRGTGNSFRIHLEPDTGLFKMDIGQASLRLYSLLHDLGIPDEKLEQTWGADLLDKNRKMYDVRVFDKAYQKLVRRADPNADKQMKAQAILGALQETKLSRKVLDRTLPNRFNTKIAAQWKRGSMMQIPDPVPTESSQENFSKADYMMLAQFLNQNFKAGIPTELPTHELVSAVLNALHQLMPGYKSDLVSQLMSAKLSSKITLERKPQAA
jgi:DNA-directed RNA polymerase beta subunit